MRKCNSLDKALIIYVKYIVFIFRVKWSERNKEGIIISMDKLLDLTRDFDAAKAAFEAYLDEYDRADDKIHLKIVHTYGVVDAAEDIARRMGLDEEDVQLAKVIGLLHDIGRFEQIRTI